MSSFRLSAREGTGHLTLSHRYQEFRSSSRQWVKQGLGVTTIPTLDPLNDSFDVRGCERIPDLHETRRSR